MYACVYSVRARICLLQDGRAFYDVWFTVVCTCICMEVPTSESEYVEISVFSEMSTCKYMYIALILLPKIKLFFFYLAVFVA